MPRRPEPSDHYDPTVFTFFAMGEPVPQGSKKAWLDKKTHRVMMTEDQGTRHTAWRHIVTSAAAAAMTGDPISVPVTVAITFSFHRGIGHYGTGGNARVLKDSAPPYPSKPPDIDKLIRAVLDSMTDAMVWTDDSLVVSITARKRWVDRFTQAQGVSVKVGLMP